MTKHILKLKIGGQPQYLIEEDKHFVPLTERRLAKLIPHFLEFNEKARAKKFVQWLKNDANIVRSAKINLHLHNAPRKLKTGNDSRCLTKKDLQQGARALLNLAALTPSDMFNHQLMGLMVCSMHVDALRKHASEFQPIIRVRAEAQEALEMCESIVKVIVTKDRWTGKHCVVKRNAILDYKTSFHQLPRHINDHTQLKVKVKGTHSAKIPFPYTDTIAVVENANSTQLREAAPYLENSGVILVNCNGSEFNQNRLPSPIILDAYDHEVLSTLVSNTPYIAALLQMWWNFFEDEDHWAKQIIKTARSALGRPDDRFIHFSVDPKRLKDAIYHQVLLSFLDFLEDCEFMTADELDPYRKGITNTFAPAPQEPMVSQAIRTPDKPEVFLEVMRQLVKDPSLTIFAENERFVKGAKNLGAWRQISGTLFLVMLEETWARIYAKAVRAKKNIDTTLFCETKWELTVQKALSSKKKIKPATSGYRARYDLYGNNTRDTTYVVAVPASLLDL